MESPLPRTGSLPRPGPAAGWLRRISDSRLIFALQVLTLLAMTGTVATRLWQDHMWTGVALVGVTLAVWAPEVRRRRMRAWWFAYVAGIFIYTLLRAAADETAIPIRTTYDIRADHLLFFGSDPVVWLQDRLFSTTRVSPLDVFAVQVHWSFFVAPHLAAILIYWRHREQFPRYTAAVVGTMYLGLLLFFLVPTTPPWLAGQEGALSGVYRIMDFVGGRVDGDTYRSFYASLAEPNSVAAMPSIHMGVTFAMYLWARENRPRLAWLLLAYCAVMAFSLVYLAEHYALDLLVGMACAVACHFAAKRWVPAPSPVASQPSPEGA
jgi:membrane-associated phospholipid phosphatase